MRKHGLKIAVLLLSAVFVFSVFPSLKSSADTYYDFDEGVLTISGSGEIIRDDVLIAYLNEYGSLDVGFNNVKEIIIEGDEEHKISSIGEFAFSGFAKVTTITIPESVESIGYAAFSSCTSLTSIKIPDGVKSIEGQAFNGCSSLETITIPATVTSIGEKAFYDCSSLANITIPSGVTSIGDETFSGCSNLTSITIPATVTSIGEKAFYRCTSLSNITIPSSVTSIGNEAFGYCICLTSVTISEGVTSIGDSAFYGCSGLTSVTIPEGVTKIGNEAFRGCYNLTSITIPKGVTSIGDSAFYGCYGLTSVTIPEGVTKIGNETFRDCTGLTSITIPKGVTSIGDSAFYGCYGLTSIDIPGSITSIGNNAFSYCTGLTSVTIPEGVTAIGCEAFSECSGLTSVTIPEGVTKIGSGTFYECSGLTSVTIPESVISIGADAFNGCSSLTSITIPDSVTSIDGNAFGNCTGLKEVVMGIVGDLAPTAFEGCPSDIKFHYYYYVTYTTEGYGAVEGNAVTYGSEKIIVKPEENNKVNKVIFDYKGPNETIIEADKNGDYILPDLDDSVAERNIEIRTIFEPVKVTVVFYDEDGTTVLWSDNYDIGTVPVYNEPEPTKAENEQYTYRFAGWKDEDDNTYGKVGTLPPVTSDGATYTAVYESDTKIYTITFLNYDGTFLLSDQFEYGNTPTYFGEDPVKADDKDYMYMYTGWTDGTNNYDILRLPKVTGDATYSAVFSPIRNSGVAPVKPVIDPGIKPATNTAVQKPGVYYLNNITGDGINSDIIVTIKRTENDANCINYFGRATVDGTTMTVGEQIDVGSGSTIITIKKDFLATLSEGNHILEVFFNDGGTITIEFTVKAATNNAANVPSTGEGISYYAIAGLMLAGAGVIVFGLRQKEKRTVRK